MKNSIFVWLGLIRMSTGHLRKLSNKTSHNCVLTKIDSLNIPSTDEDFFEQTHEEKDEWRCVLEDEDDAHAYEIDGVPSDYISEHMGQWESGKTTLKISEAELTGLGPDDSPPKVVVSENAEIVTQTSTEEETTRRLAPKTGTGTVLVIRVTDASGAAPSRSATALASDVFTDTVNLNSSYMACSGGKLGYIAATGNNIVGGVYELQITQNVAGVSSSTVEGWVDTQASALLGSLRQWTLVMYVLPGSVAFGGAAAYAYINSWKSVYLNSYASYPVVLVHEVGHNLGLAHSGKGGVTYGDKTCWMGNGVGAFWYNDDIPRMCFNAPKNWQLGWYSDRNALVIPTQTGRWEGKLVGIDDYLEDQIPSTSTEHHVTVKIDKPNTSTDLYIFYNRKEGRTSDIPYDFDKVVVYSQGAGYSPSSNLAQLSAGQTYTSSNFDGSNNLIIKVCDIVAGTPDYARTIVCLNNGVNNCACTIAATPSPTKRPIAITAAPTDAPSKTPTGTPIAPPTPRTAAPTDEPSKTPTGTPIAPPTPRTAAPTDAPSNTPTRTPIAPPTPSPTKAPVKTVAPTTSPSKSPTKIPTDSPSKSPTETPVSAPTPPTACQKFQLDLHTDNHGSETTWKLLDSEGDLAFSSGNEEYEDNTSYSKESECLSQGKYEFIIEDSWGDGICCRWGEGSYKLKINNKPFYGGGQFKDKDIISFELPLTCTFFQIDLNTDKYGAETKWELKDSNNSVVFSGHGYENLKSYSEKKCIAGGSYTFDIFDLWGDGMCCGNGKGEYKITVEGRTIHEGGDFAHQEQVTFTTSLSQGTRLSGVSQINNPDIINKEVSPEKNTEEDS